MRAHVSVRVCVCTCVSMRVHAHVSVCMYVYVCVCVTDVDISVMSFPLSYVQLIVLLWLLYILRHPHFHFTRYFMCIFILTC